MASHPRADRQGDAVRRSQQRRVVKMGVTLRCSDFSVTKQPTNHDQGFGLSGCKTRVAVAKVVQA